MEAVLGVSFPAGAADGETACVHAGVEIADTNATNNINSRRCVFMLASRHC